MSTQRKYLTHLTGFRAIAAFWVLLGHSFEVAFPRTSHFSELHFQSFTNLGMSLFFVLSGFVITYTYYERFTELPWHKAVWEFAVARFARLYPLYVLFLLLEPHQLPALMQMNGIEKLSFLTLTQSWWNRQRLTFIVAWSISTECFFYVCFAFWMLLCSKKQNAKSIRFYSVISLMIIFILLALLWTERSAVIATLVPLQHPSQKDIWDWIMYSSPYVRIGEFIMGICAARLYMVNEDKPASAAAITGAGLKSILSIAALLLFAMGSVVWFKPDSFLFFLSFNFGYGPFLAYLLYACSRYPNMLTTLCCSKALQTGGKISYSIYIMQYGVSILLACPIYPRNMPTLSPFIVMAIFIAITICISSYSYRFIEVPARQYLRRFARE